MRNSIGAGLRSVLRTSFAAFAVARSNFSIRQHVGYGGQTTRSRLPTGQVLSNQKNGLLVISFMFEAEPPVTGETLP